jgi:hypothetical protein
MARLSVAGGTGRPAGAPGLIVENPAGVAPRIVSGAPQNAFVGRAFVYQPMATGTPDFSWTLVSGPPNATVQATNGALEWRPTEVGVVPIVIEVSNASGVDRQSLSIVVRAAELIPDAGNPVPFFVSNPNTSAFCGAPYRYSGERVPVVQGTGPFTFGVSAPDGGLPEGLTIADTGELTWTPRPDQVGLFGLELVASSPSGTARQSFNIHVECSERPGAVVQCGCSALAPGSLCALLGLALALRRSARRRDGV